MADNNKVQLLCFWVSPFSLRVELALSWKGIPYEKLEQNLMDKSPLLLASNPVYKKIPVLLHGGRSICESIIILQYIDEAFPDPERNLLPSDPYGRANARFWADYIDKKVFESMFGIMKAKGEEEKAAAMENAAACVANVEEELGKEERGGAPFLGGEKPGLADIVLGPMLVWKGVFEAVGGVKFPWEEKFPRLNAWMAAMAQQAEFTAVLPDSAKVAEFVKMRFGM